MMSGLGHLPEVSFVVPCYRSRRTIGFTLRAIYAQETTVPYEVLVVDSSPQGIEGWIRTTFPRTRVISSGKRLGPAAARNLGAREASGAVLAFIDADAIPDQNWLEVLSSRAGDYGVHWAVGGHVANGNPEHLPSRVLYWIEFSEFMPALASERRRFLSSSNLLISRKSFLQSGGFDESVLMAEDLLFSARFAGPLFFACEAGVRHLHRARWGPVLSHLRRLGYWSGYARRLADLPGSRLVHVPAVALVLPLLRAPRILARVSAGGFREAVRAFIHFPFLLVGLFVWAAGFYRGITSYDASPHGGFSDTSD